MYGADVDALTATARRFGRSSDVLFAHRVELDSLYSVASWTGRDADRSRAAWAMAGAPALADTSAFLRELESRLLEHAAQQRAASATARAAGAARDACLADTSSAVGGAGTQPPLGSFRLGDVVDELVADVVELTADVVDASERTLAELLGAVPARSAAPDTPAAPAAVAGLRPSPFGSPADGRAAVVAAMEGLADESRIARDEIEIRALENGRYIVVLPGVTDLSAGIDQFVDRVRDNPLGVGDAGRGVYDAWADNDEPTVRKMRYAFEAALRDDSTVNEYSVVAADSLQAAGVPEGAEVMIVGHSFGAYTAIDLAADPAFNVAHGARPDGYHVAVTHVVAAGAETDWRFDELPAGTNALVVNNRFDLVYRVEDVLHRDGDARHPGHVEQNFWGNWQGKGHDERNYIEWLADTGNDRVEAWLADATDHYAAAGTRVSVTVPDPNL